MQELSEALYGGYLRSEELLVLQLGNRCQRGHQDYMRDTNGKWQNDSATWFLCLAERRDLFLPGFGNVTLTQGDVAVLFANTWHAGVAEQAGAHGSEVLFGYFDRATNFSAAEAKCQTWDQRSSCSTLHFIRGSAELPKLQAIVVVVQLLVPPKRVPLLMFLRMAGCCFIEAPIA